MVFLILTPLLQTQGKTPFRLSITAVTSLLFLSFLLLSDHVMSISTSSSTTQTSYDLLVIGGGSAGLTAAKFAATFGNSVAIIEKEKLGGDCTWSGCIPSKSLLASAKAAHAVRKASEFGVSVQGEVSVNMKAVRERVRRNINRVYEEDDSPEALKKLGIDTIHGTPKFVDSKTLEVVSDEKNKSEQKIVGAKYGVLVATGARPRKNTNIPGLDSVNYITYEEVFDLDEVPEFITVVGGGPVGVELSQALSRLGAKVTIISEKLLSREEPEIGEALATIFKDEGITVTDSRLSNVKSLPGTDSAHLATCVNGATVKGDLMLVATGRRPVVDGMGLTELGVELNESGGINVDDKLRSTVKNVYAAGDCTGDSQFTHYAGYQGAVAARNILLPFSDPGVLENVPATTFTDPEIASVGMTEAVAKAAFGEDAVQVSLKYVKDTDRGICEGVKGGLIKIIYQKKGYKILGVTVMSPGAGEMIAEIGVAMKKNLSFDNLATVMHTYPSHSFALQAMAAEVYYDKLVKMKGLLKFLKKIGL